jgi:uncharacterized protein
MPYLQKSSYTKPPFYQFNGHLQTIIPAFRKIKGVKFRRERIVTLDNDFLDLDWLDNNTNRLVVLTHGFEGNSSRPYMLGMAKIFTENNWDILSWNCRSCSEEINKAFKMYNHGNIDDLEYVINHATTIKNYEEIILVGFSMGGNITLKYASLKAHPSVKKVIAYSAPLDMKSSIEILAERRNWLYRLNFEKKLQPKLEKKRLQYPDKLNKQDISHTEWKKQLHTYFCKINGYKDLESFYEKGSALNFIPQIKIPALIVQAINDPMLTPECFPYDLATNHPFIHLETPQYGGHCGFSLANDSQFSWAEHRALAFSKDGF